MALTERSPLVRKKSTEVNATAQGQKGVEGGARPLNQTSLDGSMTNLYTPPIEISTPSVPRTSYLDAPSSHETTSAPISPRWTRTSSDSLEPGSCSVKGKGKETVRGRTSERTGRAANPMVRAESHPRRLDPSFELISQPIPVRPLPIERTTGHLSRSNTFYKDPSDPCATLDDEILEQCPRTPTIPMAEMLVQPAEDLHLDHHSPAQVMDTETSSSEAQATDTPTSPLTGFFRSDSNALYELKITKISDEKPALYPAPTLPLDIISKILPNISHLEYLALKSSAKEWSESSYNVDEDEEKSAQPTEPEKPQSQTHKPAIVASLPVEIILQIYHHLGPSDFNAIRRINRKWFISSLEKGLLQKMLRRGGWSGCRSWNLTTNHIIDDDDERRVRVNVEWIMSKKIARECALGPGWTGNGLLPVLSPVLLSSLDIPGISANQDNQDSDGITAFKLTTVTDFTEIGTHYPNSTPGSGASGAGTIFTVSMCGKFLMAATGCLIYIYELNRSNESSPEEKALDPGGLRPVTSIICPRRVLACSMDTSSFRYAIAVLLDGRMGLVCDITAPGTESPRARSGSNKTVTAMGGTWSQAGPSLGRSSVNHGSSTYRNNVTINSSTSNAFERAVTEKPYVFPVIAADKSQRPKPPGPSGSDFQEAAWQDMLYGDLPDSSIKSLPGSRRTSYQTDGNVGEKSHNRRVPVGTRPFSTASQANMPLEYGPRSIYRNLCSDDDPPRSVAICPQRRCVAFGCSAGIELHWVDALTGQDLNRWFPLTAPSDFLFFLPPRRGIDSAKKLRLISSAARPTETTALAERFRSSSVAARTKTNVAFHNAMNGSALAPRRTDDSDHYRAVPLSDGYHILFTNPVTGVLCLGSDAPIGGPMKLLRKIWFMGPKGENRNCPVAYAGGGDLKEGVRVVAAYDDVDGVSQSVWLFSVPCDVFSDSQTVMSDEVGGDKKNSEWRDWWEEDFTDDDWRNPENALPTSTDGLRPSTPSSSSPKWPIQVRGQKIGSCHGVIDLAIQSGPELSIWAFTRSGMAFVWQVDDGNVDTALHRRVVMRDGTIREIDGDGDTEMLDRDSDVDSLMVEAPTPGPHDLPLGVRSNPMPESFDGTASYYSHFHLPCGSSPLLPHRLHSSEHGYESDGDTDDSPPSTYVERVDADGDVLMADLPDLWPGGEAEPFVAAEGSHPERLAGNEGRVRRWRGGYIVEGADGGAGADMIEELTGVARMEVEIHH